uniref:Sodium-dependent phosphate transporter n=1 Tax=Leptocylindrus danicus TaxID=163516 RepID=A0A7S2NVL2_9STRA|mmetsp:Transcript_14074/g.20805  ORF Transcript_14074/g.20805 Transcript_14074/m.20805 type:complete len:588 (+) Transcript_14074:90-1853(+)
MSQPEEVAVEKPIVEKDTTKSREDRVTGSVHFGDTDFTTEPIGDATWGEVCTACCSHSGEEWAWIFVGFTGVVFFLYFFLFGLELLGSAAKVLGGCDAGEILGDDTNPIGALMIGILGTVLLQSSSTTTSIIVSLTGSGLGVKTGIYMVMGANIGTTVTNTIVAMGQMGDADQLERAFAGATVHDMFNFCTVAILLPVEVITGYLYHLTDAMVDGAEVTDDEKWEGPIKKIVSPLAAKLIIANKSVIKNIAKAGLDEDKEDITCDKYYPVACDDDIKDYKHCNKGENEKVGLIGCDKKTGDCPAFFEIGATQEEDETSGGVCLFLSLVILVTCLIGMVYLLQKMLMGMSTRIIYKATDLHPLLSMVVGVGVTMIVQSSSITTSVLTPLVGLGVIRLDTMFPMTLGANIGTTVTGILAAMVSDNITSLQVALAHLMFNITGIVIWYPVPFMRNIPLNAARKLGKATRSYRLFPLIYILVLYFGVPAILIGISTLFEEDTKAYTALGTMLVIFVFLAMVYFVYWWKYQEGESKTTACLATRQKKLITMETLPEDMDYLKSELARLKSHTGLADEVKDDEVAEEDVEEEA